MATANKDVDILNKDGPTAYKDADILNRKALHTLRTQFPPAGRVFLFA